MGRMADALKVLRGGEAKAAPGAEIVLGGITSPTITTAQIDRAMDGAARLSSVLAAALTWSARNFAEAPLVALKGGEPDYSHPFTRLFARPTAFHSQAAFWQRFVMLLMTDPGGAYIVAARDDAGEIGGLWPRSSKHVRPIVSPTEYIAGWEFTTGGFATRVDEDRYTVVRQQYASAEPDDEFYSMCPIEQVRREVRTHATASLWLDSILQNMGVSSGLIGIDHPSLDGKTAKAVQDEINERMGGAHRGGTFSVLAGKITVAEVGMKLGELDFGPLVDRMEVAVARAFGMPAELLQVLASVGKGEGLNASAYRDKARIAYDNGIIPLWKDTAESIATRIGPAYGLGPDDIAFDYSDIEALSDDLMRKVQVAVAALPFLEVNEAREVAGYAPVPWGNVNFQAALYGRLASTPAVKSGIEHKAEPDLLARYAAWEAKASGMEPGFERAARAVFDAEAEAIAEAVSGKRTPAEIRDAAQDAVDADRWIDAMTSPIGLALTEGYNDARAMLAPGKAAERGFGITDPDAIAAAAERVAKLAGEVTQTTKDRIAELVAQGIEAGFSPEQVADAVREYAFDGQITKHRAFTIARTESMAAMNEGGLYGARAVERDLGLTVKKMWLTAGGDARSLHLQAEAAGWVALDSDFGVGADAPGSFGIAGQDINCFPGDVTVQAGSVEGAYRRFYEGDVIEVTTAEGHVLAGTPNHPVLTDGGWRGLGSLDECSKLAYAVVGEEIALRDPDVDHVPARIEQVFESMPTVAVIERVGAVDVDFHGDGMHGKVEIVRADGKLTDAGVPEFTESVSDEQFASADLGPAHLTSERLVVSLAETDASAATSDVSGGDQTPALVGVSAAHADEHSLAAPARSDTLGDEPTPDSSATDAEAIGDRLLGFPCEIRFTDVVKVEVRHYSGHVYNLQTATGSYIANGIVAHNCRCSLVYEAS